MPMFCPKCDVIMKKRLDNKFWSMFGHCFDCQLKIENKMNHSKNMVFIIYATHL